jgi:hypothetical protein
MSPETITVEILNWAKYNPRKDVTRPSWLRLENGLLESPEFTDFTHEELIAWIYILSQSSKKYSPRVTIFFEHAHRVRKISPKALRSAISKLVKLATVRVIPADQLEAPDTPLERHAYDTHLPATERNETERNGTKDEDSSPGSQSDLLGASVGDEGVQESLPEEFAPIAAILAARGVPCSVQRRWLQAYPDPRWIMQEVRKAELWEATNPGRRKKNFAAFISRWIAKGWDTRPMPQAGPSSGPVIPSRRPPIADDPDVERWEREAKAQLEGHA